MYDKTIQVTSTIVCDKLIIILLQSLPITRLCPLYKRVRANRSLPHIRKPVPRVRINAEFAMCAGVLLELGIVALMRG